VMSQVDLGLTSVGRFGSADSAISANDANQKPGASQLFIVGKLMFIIVFIVLFGSSCITYQSNSKSFQKIRRYTTRAWLIYSQL
jgi:hypothetical protein